MTYRELTELMHDKDGILQTTYPVIAVSGPKVIHMHSAPTLLQAFGGPMFDDPESAEQLLSSTFERNLAYLIRLQSPPQAHAYALSRSADGRIIAHTIEAKVTSTGLFIEKITPPQSYVAVQYYRYNFPNNPHDPINV